MGGYTNRAYVVDWHDGDTVRVVVDVWPTLDAAVPVRLVGINTPELGRPGAREARDRARALAPAGTQVTVVVGNQNTDKYGRILGTILTPDGTNVNTTLLEEGLAAPYDGGAR